MNDRVGPPRASAALVAVLAGGAGHRAGGSKALVELAGRTLISYPLRAAAAAALPALVVAKRDTELPAVQVPVVREPDEPRHPLCGIVAALREAGGPEDPRRPVLVVGCDMPFVSAALLRWLARRPGETAAVELAGRLQPFPALYRPAALERLEAELRLAGPLRATLELLSAEVLAEHALRAFGDPDRLCFSVNDAHDLRLAREWLA